VREGRGPRCHRCRHRSGVDAAPKLVFISGGCPRNLRDSKKRFKNRLTELSAGWRVNHGCYNGQRDLSDGPRDRAVVLKSISLVFLSVHIVVFRFRCSFCVPSRYPSLCKSTLEFVVIRVTKINVACYLNRNQGNIGWNQADGAGSSLAVWWRDAGTHRISHFYRPAPLGTGPPQPCAHPVALPPSQSGTCIQCICMHIPCIWHANL